MKPRYSKIFYVVSAVIVILLLGLLRVAFADIDEQFEKQLLRIRSRGRKASTLKDYQELEAQSLKLVKDHNTPNEKGMIHAMIALAYSDKGLGLSNDVKEVQMSKTIEYGKKALVHPLPDILISCRVHGKLAALYSPKLCEVQKTNLPKLSGRLSFPA
ncbi:MAG: hypothetical protein ACYTFW_20290 [Planctomycetota bacterium]|jgi:hypothetical protein